MKRKPFGWCVSLVAIVVMSLPAGRVAAQTRYFKVSSGYWTNATHWDNGVPVSNEYAYVGTTSGDGVTPATCILDTAGQECSRLYLGVNASDSGQVDFTGGDLTSYGTAYVGNKGTGIVNQSDGIWDMGGQTLEVGYYNAGAVGTLNLSGGAITNIGLLTCPRNGRGTINLSDNGLLRMSGTEIANMGSASGTGVVNQTGGTWDNGGAYLQIASHADAYCEFNISDGVLTNVSRLYNTVSGAGLLSITGSDAEIYVQEYRGDNAGGTVRVAPDSGGISPINASGSIWLSGTTLEVDFSNYTSTEPLTIINYGISRNGDFADVLVLTDGWSADISYATANEVRLVNITSPPKGTVVSIR